MNLHQFSQQNNLEIGILSRAQNAIKQIASFATLGNFVDETYYDSFIFIEKIIKQSDLIFDKRPNFKKGSLLTSSKYENSEILIDKTLEMFKQKQVSKVAPSIPKEQQKSFGFCIRTGVQIPFDPARPFCAEAFKSWATYKNRDFPEKYCHKTGKLSNGKTSMRNPILAN